MHNKYLSVLVIEDNNGDFVLIEDYLIEAFITVQITRYRTFKEYTNFINQNKNIKYDIILLDLYLPDLSGMELIKCTLELQPKAPIIILTGYADLTLAKNSLKSGVDDFLIKDEISPSILHKSIEFTISRSIYINHIQVQNEKLKNIAWTQSHVVRAPLSRILGIINLIESQKEDLQDFQFWLNQLKKSIDEMDTIVKKITEEAQEIKTNNRNE
jgi:FixJ family two-component response regulator